MHVFYSKVRFKKVFSSAVLIEHNSVGNVNNALADAEKCVRLNPTWMKGHNRKANCLMRLGRESDAAKSYRAAIECDPENLEGN